MGYYADYMDTVDLSIASPDGKIKARLRKNTNVTLAIVPCAYQKYNDSSLAHQLTALVRLLYASHRRAHIEAMSAALMSTAGRRAEVHKKQQLSARERKFRDLLEDLESRGVSRDRLVQIFNTGMRNWQVRITPGTVDKIGEGAFKQEFATALGDLLTDYRLKLASLKQKVYSQPKPTESGKKQRGTG